MPEREKRGRGRGRAKRPRTEGPPRDVPQSQGFRSSTQPSNVSPTQFFETVLSTSPPVRSLSAIASAPGQPSEQPQSPASRAPPGKVAIPALRPPQSSEPSGKGSRKGRTSHACNHCRKAKAGCTGEQPCQRCRNANIPCVYGDGKRVKDRKRMTNLSRKSNSLYQHSSNVADALSQIQHNANLSMDEIRAAIDHILSMAPELLSDDEEGSDVASARLSSEDVGEADADAEVGSTGSIDVINVDADQDDTRGTGHMGKSSAVAWAKRTADEYEKAVGKDTTLGHDGNGLTLASYHTEEGDLEDVDTSNVNPYDWPEVKLADALVQSYFAHVHDPFPILDKSNFMKTYRDFRRGSSDISKQEAIWLGTLNCVFAIAAVHAHLTRSEFEGHHFDHLIYSARAKRLCMDEGLLYQNARVSLARCAGLLTLYYITTGRLNRAWTLCGANIRQAHTLGLHVRSEAKELSDLEKEQRVRLWWSLYSLECLLDELTGRPSCVSDRDISTPLPVNIDIEDWDPAKDLYKRNISPAEKRPGSRRGSHSGRPAATYQMPIGVVHPLTYHFPVVELPLTSSTYFIYRIQLSIISHEIVTQLYCAASIKQKWIEVQETIHRIDRRLLAWRDSLPSELDIDFDNWSAPDFSNEYTHPRLGLAMLWNSSRMILFRPCLCRWEGRMVGLSEKARDFNQAGVESCVHSARKMITLLSLTAHSVQRLYSISPWWNTLHYLCEALSVLMLEMAFRAQHMPNESAYILEDAKKGIRWLSMMAEQSVSARKAWEIFDSLIRHVAPMIKWSVFDLATEAPVPLGYNWRRFNTANLPDPRQQPSLTQSNLDELNTFQSTQPPPQQQSQAWSAPQDQNLGYLTMPYGNQTQFHQPMEQFASNPLNSPTAFQQFSSIGNVHGHYDDPWHHVFEFTTAAESMGLVAPHYEMTTQPSSTADTGGFYNQPAFDTRMVGFQMGEGGQGQLPQEQQQHQHGFGEGAQEQGQERGFGF